MGTEQRTRPGPAATDLPSMYVLGFPKTGSTTLHQRLVDAGAVSATVKEPSVLLLDDDKVGDVVSAYERYYPTASSGPRIDATPYYIYDTRALERIDRLGAATHVLVSIREPWSRIRSLYLDQFMQGFEKRTLQDALVAELGCGAPTGSPQARSRRRPTGRRPHRCRARRFEPPDPGARARALGGSPPGVADRLIRSPATRSARGHPLGY